jgi:hypothetical protein
VIDCHLARLKVVSDACLEPGDTVGVSIPVTDMPWRSRSAFLDGRSWSSRR